MSKGPWEVRENLYGPHAFLVYVCQGKQLVLWLAIAFYHGLLPSFHSPGVPGQPGGSHPLPGMPPAASFPFTFLPFVASPYPGFA